MATQLFQVEKAEAPADMAWWKLPVGWVKLTDADGNSVVGALMPKGHIDAKIDGITGTVCGPQDCAATIAAARALFA